jgi:hypothetical protein
MISLGHCVLGIYRFKTQIRESTGDWPCHREGGKSPASHRRGLGSLPGQSM